MKQALREFRNRLYHLSCVVAAVVVAMVGAFSVLSTSNVAAASQVADRSIEMSTSAPSATGVDYTVTFTPATTGAESMVLDFCSNSSIIGGSCSAPGGFSASSVTFTAGTGTANWALGTSSATTVKINDGTGSALGTSAITFTLGNITNPNTAATFYARVYTYANATYGTYSSPTSVGSDLDYGGFALSTANVINITATVMESLTFCVSKAAPGSSCSGTSAPTLTLGHGSPATLDSTAVDTDTAYTQISTNALSGVVVNMKATNTCTGLSRDGGATCEIQGVGSFAPITTSDTTAYFGLNVADGSGGTGTVSANGNYGTTSGDYGMGSSVTSTYGDTIESSSTVCSNVNSLLTFAAHAVATTPAGVYSASESLTATGTF